MSNSTEEINTIFTQLFKIYPVVFGTQKIHYLFHKTPANDPTPLSLTFLFLLQ